MRESSRIVPLGEALSAVDSAEAVADRKKRALAMAKELAGAARGPMFMLASHADIDSIRQKFQVDHRGGQLYGAKLHEAEIAAGRAADAVVFKQCEITLRAQDVQAVYNDPDRQEAERVWQAYAKGVTAIAWAQGNKESDFIRRWRELIDARRDAAEYDDAAAIRSIDARLLRLVGIPHPVLPEAAWEAADLLSAAERLAEYERLERKYGPRNPSTNGTGKTRSLRKTRPLQAVAIN